MIFISGVHSLLDRATQRPSIMSGMGASRALAEFCQFLPNPSAEFAGPGSDSSFGGRLPNAGCILFEMYQARQELGSGSVQNTESTDDTPSILWGSDRS